MADFIYNKSWGRIKVNSYLKNVNVKLTKAHKSPCRGIKRSLRIQMNWKEKHLTAEKTEKRILLSFITVRICLSVCLLNSCTQEISFHPWVDRLLIFFCHKESFCDIWLNVWTYVIFFQPTALPKENKVSIKNLTGSSLSIVTWPKNWCLLMSRKKILICWWEESFFFKFLEELHLELEACL